MNEYYVELENKNVSYMLMYNDYPPDVANLTADVMLERFRDGAVSGKTLLSDEVISLNGVPAGPLPAAIRTAGSMMFTSFS